MAISFPALLKFANFPQDQIDQLMSNIDYLTPDDQLKLTNTAWYCIAQKYYLQLNLARVRLLDEVKQGKRKYNPNDIEEAKAKLLHELVQKLQATDTQSSIEEIRQQLEVFKSKPLVSDHSSPTPPPQKP